MNGLAAGLKGPNATAAFSKAPSNPEWPRWAHAAGRVQTCGVVSKEVDSVVRKHNFIRADSFAGLDDAVDISIKKGIQLVDEQGERIFG